MFTGLVDDIGVIEAVEPAAAGRTFRVRCRYTDLSDGESIALTEEQYFAEMDRRKKKLGWTDKDDVILGCPLCNTKPMPVSNEPRAPRGTTSTGTGTGAGGQ